MKLSKRLALNASLVLLATATPVAAAGRPVVVTPPPVPGDIQVEAGNEAFLMLHAVGTQNQVCLPNTAGTALVWKPYGPQATLFDAAGVQVATHFLSTNPDEVGKDRPTWQHSRDTSAVWGEQIGISTDAAYVAPGAIPWLLLHVVGDEDGPTGGDKLSETTFIHRVNTEGGNPPTLECSPLGARMLVPYEADYVFYREK